MPVIVYTYLVSDVRDESGELRIRGELSHMLHQVLDHLQVTLQTWGETHNHTQAKLQVLHCTSDTLNVELECEKHTFRMCKREGQKKYYM